MKIKANQIFSLVIDLGFHWKGKVVTWNYMLIRIIILSLVMHVGLHAQKSDTLDLKRYEMAQNLTWGNISKHVTNLNLNPNWKKDNSGFWFVKQTDVESKYMSIDFSTMEAEDIFDHELLSKKINSLTDLETSSGSLGLNDLNFLSKKVIGFTIGGKKFNYNLGSNILTQKENKPEINQLETPSPNGRWIAYVKDYNLFVRQRDGDQVIQLSTNGVKDYEYASRYGWFDKMEGEHGERPERFSVQWSPDSKKIFCNIVDYCNASKMYMLDNSIDSLYRPKLLSYYRGAPGSTDIVYYHPVVFDIESEKETMISIKPVPHFMGIYHTWINDGEELLLTHWERGFKKVSISKVDFKNGRLKEIYSEESDIGIEFSAFVPYHSEEHNAFIFTSEKSGWKQLYKLELSNNQVTPLTKGEYFIDEIKHIDEENKVIYFTAAGKALDTNPYHNYLYRIDFNGENLKQLTFAVGHHDIYISPDGKYFVDNHSSYEISTSSALVDTKSGNTQMELSKAGTHYLDSLGWKSPQAFKVKAGDSMTDIYGVLYKPTDFDPSKSYPIIDATYTGPHTSRFPKSYYSTIRSNAPALAELGFVIIRVDGRGSNHRSRDFRSYSYKNLGGGLDDHVTAIKTLARKYSWIDTTRVGIFGHSAGGYDTGRALLAYGDFYKVGVASSADHDHRMEKAWWPEMYMGWPVDKAYEEQSNITNAKNLTGKLLLVHGALDDNVNISATMKLSEALINAGKEFDQLIIPSQRHGYGGKSTFYFAKKRWNYFVEHLLGKVPRWDIK